MKIEIKCRFTANVLFSFEHDENSIKLTLEKAVEAKISLSGANLSDANLRGAYLSGANLIGANLSGANLSYANLRGANLIGAYLSGANLIGANLSGAYLSDADLSDANLSGAYLSDADLSDANLSGANLSYANLRGANLSGANLIGANLIGANLSDANLSSADLRQFKTDFFDVLLRARNEIPGLRLAIVEGLVDGSTYSGECACLVGTIANVRNVNFEQIEHDSGRPIEQWFMGIRKGDTPETNQQSAIALQWLDEFMELLK